MVKSEQILNELHSLFTAALQAGSVLERNAVVPSDIPENGLLIIRDGDPGEPEIALGGFSNSYYTHPIPMELYVQHTDPVQRDQLFANLKENIGQVLADNSTLSGLINGMTYAAPPADTDLIEGAEDLKTGVLYVVVEYESPTPLT